MFGSIFLYQKKGLTMPNSKLPRMRELNTLQKIKKKHTFSGLICIFWQQWTSLALKYCVNLVEMLSVSAVSDSTPIWANFGKKIF